MPGLAQRRGGGDQHRRHDDLGQHGADRRCRAARRRQILGGQLFLDHRALLEEHHPRHDDRADIGGDEIEIFRSRNGMSMRLRRHVGQIGPREHATTRNDEFEGADADGDALDGQIGVR